MTHNKLYVGCALTAAPPEFRGSVEQLKEDLTSQWEVMHFLGLDGGTPGDVYEQDIGNVHECDAFLAIADYPANGLGWELGVADQLEKPTLIVAHRDATVSRLLTGAAAAREHIQFERYDTMTEVVQLAAHSLLRVLQYNQKREV
ncbi:hypothetical protein CR983_04045 [Candidatus Saccharibacteria bacterium]|nr:MAG: hypothetical protein CR983_04045 [Candidatus Saccharibacteria bacterium]